MEAHELYVRIGQRNAEGFCSLSIRFVSGDSELYRAEQKVGAPADRAPPTTLTTFVSEITQAISDHVGHVRARGLLPPALWPSRLLLEVESPEFFCVDWEQELAEPPLSPSMVVTRFHASSDERVLQPFELPARVLQVRHLGANAPTPSDYAMQYFRNHGVSGIGTAELAQTIRRDHFDIVHLVVNSRLNATGRGELFVEPTTSSNGGRIGDATLRRALASCRARFLVLQTISADSRAPALDVAHRLQRSGGPATLVVQGATTPYLDNLYMGIVHNFELPAAAFQGHGAPRAALFHGIGGDRVLQIKPFGDRLIRDMRQSIETSRSLLQNLDARQAPIRFGGQSEDVVGRLAASVRSNVASPGRVYDYRQESGAWNLYQADAREHASRVEQIENLQRAIDRVVNVGLFDGDREVGPDQMLKPGSPYELAVQIGRRTVWSLIDGDAAFPEHVLTRRYTAQGAELRVVVFGTPFDIVEPDRSLLLGPPPTESSRLSFPLKAPSSAGRHRLRICIYHGLNLLQSILLRVTVGASAEAARQRGALQAEVEFALSSTLTDLERFPQRQFNFLINEADDGSHTLAVVGTSLRNSFDFGEGEMRSAVDAARKALYDIAADTTTDPPQYRFDAVNSTTVERLEQDTVRLAELGYQLYSNIITGKDRQFARDLRTSLGPAGAKIQVSSVKSARYVFPWSLVYDQPLVVGALKLCPQFAADARAGKTGKWLASQVCLSKGCPHRSNTGIVCPSGFWGFKHLIEQPLSVSAEPDATGKQNMVLEIDAGAPGVDVSGLMVVSRELAQVEAHETELQSPGSFRFQVKDNKVKAAEGLLTGAAHIVYFYCHGGRDKSRTWLGIGTKERLQPSDLTGLDIDWTDIHPLVFINGCHTADFTPDDLLNFNQAFAWCRAAGVIGTEISVPERLARTFARGFLLQFHGGIPVGTALRQQRIDLLEQRNLLGLAYTPYCSADLKMVHH